MIRHKEKKLITALNIKTQNSSITITPNHFIFTQRGFLLGINVKKGDYLINKANEKVEILAVQEVLMPQKEFITVYTQRGEVLSVDGIKLS